MKWCLFLGSITLAIGIIHFISVFLDSLKFAAFVLILFSLAGFIFGFLFIKYNLQKTGSAFVIIACIILTVDLFVISRAFFPDFERNTILLLIAFFIHFIIAYISRNSGVLVISLLTLASWLGVETGYLSDWGAYFLGLNYPFRFALVSPDLLVIGYFHKKKIFLNVYKEAFAKVYYILGLLYTNISLWLLSIIGNNENFFVFWNISYRSELLLFSLIWIAFNILCFIIGGLTKNKIFINFSGIFLSINLYTRYFEYFWNKMEKWLFFITLGCISLGVGIAFEVVKKLKLKKQLLKKGT